MAFKVKKPEFDWDLEVPLVPDENGEIKYEIVKCKKVMNGETYADFINHINKMIPKATENELKSEVTQDMEKGVVMVIKQIDYLYGKGMDWWKTKVDPETILAVQRHLVDFTNVIAEKKSS